MSFIRIQTLITNIGGEGGNKTTSITSTDILASMLLSNLITSHKRPTYFIILKMTVATLPVDVMVGMLRKGETGNDILDILNVIVPEQTELTREQVCEDLGIADCPENDDEIEAYIANATVAV